MSKYKRIQTQITDGDCLAQALKATGLPFEEGTSLPLYGYRGDRRKETAEFVIRRQHIELSANDLGFHWNGSHYEAIISEYDSQTRGQQIFQQVQQQYAVAKVTKEAKVKGYTVVPQKAEGGVIRLQLRRY